MSHLDFFHPYPIQRSILELFRRLGPSGVWRFQDEFVMPSVDDVWREPTVCAGRLARAIVKHFQLPSVTVIVDYNRDLKPPGQVTVSHANEMFVELRRDVRLPKPIAALLAHEIAHIFLHRHGIRFDDTLENEMLTDTTAAFLGFGATILGGVTQDGVEESFCSGARDGAQIQYFGYIPLWGLGYVLAKREAWLGRNCAAGLQGARAHAALAQGRAEVLLERSRRPLVDRPRFQRTIARLRQLHLRPLPADKTIVFDCPICSQGLRIPEAYRQMWVRCKTCRSRCLCYA